MSLDCGSEQVTTTAKPTTRLAACLAMLASIIAAQFSYCQEKPAALVQLFPFHEGGKWGYMNAQGEVIITPRFTQAFDFEDGLALVNSGRGLVYVDAKGKQTFAIADNWESIDWVCPFADGLAAVSVKENCGYFDRQGKIIVEPRYDDVHDFSDGLAAVNVGAKSAGRPRPSLRKGGKWGFIDKSGRLAIPIQFARVDWKGFSDGLASVEIDAQPAYIDKTGKVAITLPPNIGWAEAFSEGMAHVHAPSGYGFIDKHGKYVIEPKFESASSFSDGLAAITVGKEWGYVNRSGSIAIKPEFDTAKDFSEGLAAVQKADRWYFIDKQGKVIIKGPFNDAARFRNGLARVHEGGSFLRGLHGPSYWSGGAWFYINRKGEKIRRCRADEVEFARGYGMEDR